MAESDAAVSTLRSSASNVSSYANSISGATDYTWHLKENTHCNGGLKNAIQSIDKLKNLLWVGTLGTNTDGFSDALRKDIDTRMGEERSSVPVWIPDDEFNSFYDEFCHQVCHFFHLVASCSNSYTLAGAVAVLALRSSGRPQDEAILRVGDVEAIRLRKPSVCRYHHGACARRRHQYVIYILTTSFRG